MKLINGQILLCCGRKGCPRLSKEKDQMIKIQDDFGGSILIKEEEARLIEKALDKIKEK